MDTLDLLRSALHEECGVEPQTVTGGTHLLNDIDIDSLDLLRASYRIERTCGVKLPVQQWIALEYGDTAVEKSPFLAQEVCRYIEHAMSEAPGEKKFGLLGGND